MSLRNSYRKSQKCVLSRGHKDRYLTLLSVTSWGREATRWGVTGSPVMQFDVTWDESSPGRHTSKMTESQYWPFLIEVLTQWKGSSATHHLKCTLYTVIIHQNKLWNYLALLFSTLFSSFLWTTRAAVNLLKVNELQVPGPTSHTYMPLYNIAV